MALLFAQTADGQRIDMPAGLHVGQPLVTRDGCSFVGAGVDRTIIRLDGTYGTGFQPLNKRVGTVISDCTIDCDYRANVTTALYAMIGGLEDLTVRRVRVINMHRVGTAVVGAADLDAESIWVDHSMGGGVQVGLGATRTKLRTVEVRGGKFGLVVTDGVTPGSIPGLDADGATIDLLCSQSPTFEVATASAVTAGGISCTHVLGHRSPNDLVRVLVPVCPFDPERTLRSALTVAGDRLETSNAWTRITGIGPSGERLLDPWRAHGSMRHVDPEGEATVYRCFYGGVYGYASGSITLRNGWRTAAGEAMAVPQLVDGHRVDIVRHGITGGPRDYDTGCVHVTKTALNPVLRNVTATDGGSDLFSGRAVGGRYLNCNARTGRDYVFTFTAHHGSQYVENCQAESGGVGGFYLGGGASKLVNCRADRNGWNGGGYGFAVDPTPGADDATGSSISGDGSGNHTALCNLDEFVTRPVRKATRAPARRWRQWR